MKLETTLIIGDCHRPYHDERAWQLVLKIGRWLKPKRIVQVGDFGDFYCTSRHPKDPNRPRNLEYEVDSCKKGLDDLDALGAEEKIITLGNHEANLSKYLMEKAPELFNLVKVEELFKLKKRGWRCIQWKDHVRVGKMTFTHETGYSGMNAHIQSARDVGGNVVIGHCHRLSVNYSSTILGKEHVAVSIGWLGNKKLAEYMYKAKTRDWCLGFGVGMSEPNGTMHIQPVPIVDYKAVVGLRMFSG